MHGLTDWLTNNTSTIKFSLFMFHLGKQKFYLPLDCYYIILDVPVEGVVCGKSTDFGVRQTILSLNPSSNTSVLTLASSFIKTGGKVGLTLLPYLMLQE